MWKNDEYIYGVGTLRAIAYHYEFIYDGIGFILGATVTNPWEVAEFKADFDRALNAIGLGNWTGHIDNKEFKDFRRFGQLQHVIIADIYGIPDSELEVLGLYQIPQLRGRAYKRMANHLNKGSPITHAQKARWENESFRRYGQALDGASGKVEIYPEGEWNGSWDNAVKIIENTYNSTELSL